MTKKQIYHEIEETLGLVPSFLKEIPEAQLELEWKLMKSVQMDDGPIPQKYRELIGIGIAATTKCRYCAFFHTEMAKLFGATEEEIESAVHYAKSSAGWSAYLNGLQFDFDEFKDEVRQACEHVREGQEALA